MSPVISDLADDNDEVGAIGNKFLAHVVNIEAQLGATTGRHLFFLADHLAVNDTLCYHLDALPRLLRIAVVAGLEEIPGVLEDHNALLNGLYPTMLAIIHGEADAIAIREDGDILF